MKLELLALKQKHDCLIFIGDHTVEVFLPNVLRKRVFLSFTLTAHDIDDAIINERGIWVTHSQSTFDALVDSRREQMEEV